MTGEAHRPIAIVAGEASGDLLGSLLMSALLQAYPEATFEGIAGRRMQALGARSLFPMETLSVRGYLEALSNLRQILAIRKQLKRRLLRQPPRLFIGVDAPDFNLNLERDLKLAGIPTVHFVSPSIWAWRWERIHKIRQAVSHMLLIFPFEEAIYREQGIPATYVGHPLAYALPQTIDRQAARTRLGLKPVAEYLALLPGSRDSEINQLTRLYIRTAKQIFQQRPGIELLVPLVNTRHQQLFQDIIIQEAAQALPFRFMEGQAHDVLQASDIALIASGTATLEALLLDCPHVITYKVPWLTYKLMKRRAYLPYVGLPNILAERFIVPEHIQEQAKPDVLSAALLDLLVHPEKRQEMRHAFAPIRASLHRDTPSEIARALAPYLT